MKTTVCCVTAVLVVFFASSLARADHKEHDHGAAHRGAGPQGACNFAVDITEEAERQPGGALYKGMGGHHHGEHDHMDTDAGVASDMAGTHMDHAARHGGAFYMAPNKVHHLELVYSKACGVQLYLYNAFTKPIRVDRFQAFVKLVPGDDVEAFEAVRFLAPAASWTVLTSPATIDFAPPFSVELTVKFPGIEEPKLFTMKVPAAAHCRQHGRARQYGCPSPRGPYLRAGSHVVQLGCIPLPSRRETRQRRK